MEELDKLNYFKVTCALSGNAEFRSSGYIATELDQEVVEKRLKNSEEIVEHEVEAVSREDTEFPITLIGLNEKYYNWEDLCKNYMIYKLSGVSK